MVEIQNRLKVPVVEQMLISAFGLDERDGGRNKLLARLKVLRNHGYPDKVATDPDLRKGYTALQTLKLIAVFALLDQRYLQSEAIEIVTRHKSAFLATMAIALDISRYPGAAPVEADMLVILPGKALDELRKPRKDAPLLIIANGWDGISPLPDLDELHGRAPTVVDLAIPTRRAIAWLELEQEITLAGLDILLSSAKQKASASDGMLVHHRG